MLLHVEKQVATFASRIEVWDLAQPLQLNARAVGGQIAAESTDVIGCACVAVRSNEFTRLDYVPSRKLAVEAQPRDKHLRRAVIWHWCKRRERQSAPQFSIDVQYVVAYWQFHPAWVRILF